jgi:hypothetical protein
MDGRGITIVVYYIFSCLIIVIGAERLTSFSQLLSQLEGSDELT